jgi:hypothetical protein
MTLQVSIVEIIADNLKTPNQMNTKHLPTSFFGVIVTLLGNEHLRQ